MVNINALLVQAFLSIYGYEEAFVFIKMISGYLFNSFLALQFSFMEKA
jgi:hypothetical protein